MPNAPKIILKLCLFAGILWGASILFEYFYNKQRGGDLFGGTKDYPAKVSLKNLQGNSLDVTLTARNSKYIQFTRNSDQRDFIYLIENLATESQAIVRSYPDLGLNNAGKHLAQSDIKLNEVHVEAMRDSIRKIESRMAYLETKLNRANDTATIRGISLEIDDLNEEKLGLIEKIAVYDRQSSLVEQERNLATGGAATAMGDSGSQSGGAVNRIKASLSNIFQVSDQVDERDEKLSGLLRD